MPARPKKFQDGEAAALVMTRRHELGVIPDTHLAAQLGVDPATVRTCRIGLGIEPAPQPWKDAATRLVDEHRHLVGVNTDSEIARMLGISFPTVKKYRIEHGIPMAMRSPRELGKAARALVLANRALLGRSPDDDVAARLGVTPSLIHRVRNELGIPASREWRSRGAVRSAPVRESLEAHREILGVTLDRVVAERLGCSMQSVRQFRIRNGIPMVVARAPQPSWHASPTRRPTACWRVDFLVGGRTRSGYVIAETLAEAASRALSAPGRVIGLAWIGEMLVTRSGSTGSGPRFAGLHSGGGAE